MRRTKRIISIVVMALIVFALAGCSMGKKSRSGEYTLAEFYKLVEPADTAFNKAIDESMDKDLSGDEYDNYVYGAYTDELKAAGFKGEETITLTATFEYASRYEDEGTIYLSDGGSNWHHFNFDAGKYGWVVLLTYGTEVKIQFSVDVTDKGFLELGNADILSPSQPEYKADCSNVVNERDAVIFGEVEDVFTFKLTKDEIKEEQENNTGNELRWYEAMEYSDNYIIIKDDAGNRVGAFIDTYSSGGIDVGQKIGCAGTAYRVDAGDLPDYFIDSTLLGGYYVFED